MPAAAGGRISGSSISVSATARPRNSRVASRYAAGVPTSDDDRDGDRGRLKAQHAARRPRPGRRGCAISSRGPTSTKIATTGSERKRQREGRGGDEQRREETAARRMAHGAVREAGRARAPLRRRRRAGPSTNARASLAVLRPLHDRGSVDDDRLAAAGARSPRSRPPERPHVGDVDEARHRPRPARPCRRRPTRRARSSGCCARSPRACSRAEPREHLARVRADRHARRAGGDA